MGKRHLIDWVEQDCREWGRWVFHRNCVPEGHASRSIVAKFKEGGQTGHTSFDQRYPEMTRPNVLALDRAWHQLNDHGRAVIFAHYAIRGKAQQKWLILGWAGRTYWWRLGRANARLAALLTEKGCAGPLLYSTVAGNMAVV